MRAQRALYEGIIGFLLEADPIGFESSGLVIDLLLLEFFLSCTTGTCTASLRVCRSTDFELA